MSSLDDLPPLLARQFLAGGRILFLGPDTDDDPDELGGAQFDFDEMGIDPEEEIELRLAALRARGIE